MGIFSGGFFGGGTTESEVRTENRISTTTETETNIRDIGITGNAAVALTDTLAGTALARDHLYTSVLKDYGALFAKGFNTASQGIQGAVKGSADLIKHGYVYSDKNFERQSNLAKFSTQQAYDSINTQTQMLLNAGGEVSSNIFEKIFDAANNLLTTSTNQQSAILSSTKSFSDAVLSDTSDIKTGGFSTATKMFGYIIAGFFIFLLIILWRK